MGLEGVIEIEVEELVLDGEPLAEEEGVGDAPEVELLNNGPIEAVEFAMLEKLLEKDSGLELEELFGEPAGFKKGV